MQPTMPQPVHLFAPLTLRSVTVRNRIMMSPMCQYSAHDGLPTEWHPLHLASRAVGGTGLVMVEATAVEPRGRITPHDLGIWTDAHGEALRGLAEAIAQHGGTPAIQLAHAGRKASSARPWDGGRPLAADAGGWPVVAPSALPFAEGHPTPEALDRDGIDALVQAFVDGARRALGAGFRVAEIHAAHGYLLHEFLSPISNRRSDRYGGPFENRVRLLEEVVTAVRAVWPDDLPLLVRISATEWRDDGWTLADSTTLAGRLQRLGVDLIDCSSAGNAPALGASVGPGYQTHLAAGIRGVTGVPTAAVGMITEPAQADHVIRTGQADLVALGRVLLREPYWPLRAAHELGADVDWPAQYLRAKH